MQFSFYQDMTSDDEEQWQRIKNMEQTRTISAMKNHIQKLEEKLDSLQNIGDIDDFTASNSENVAGTDCTTSGHVESGSQKHQKIKEVGEENTEVTKVEPHRLEESSYGYSSDTLERGENALAYKEKDSVPLNGNVSNEHRSVMEEKNAEANVEENRFTFEADEENDSEIEVRLDSGLASDIIDEITNDDLEVCDSPKGNSETPEDDFFHGNSNLSGGIQEHGVDDMNHDYSLHESREAQLQSDTQESQSTSIKQFEDFTNPGSTNKADDLEVSHIQADANENSATSEVSHKNSDCDHRSEIGYETDTNKVEERNSLSIVETPESVPFVDKPKLEEINLELRERVSALEEQLWLAAEDRRNIQAVLELQKERALKNLAFKFEEINRKTLREFKGIFEYRLQELNEEKLRLQEQLQSHKCPEGCNVSICDECISLKERLAESEEKYAKLLGENQVLKRRCRKLSGDLGKVKKVVGSLPAGDDKVGVDVSIQTDTCDLKKEEVGIQCKISPDTSLNDLHNDVRDIATKISVISSCLVGQQREISQDESFTDNDILNSVSSTNESGIGSLQISPASHEDSDHRQYNALSYWDNSKENDQTTISDFFGEKGNQFSHSVDESDSVVFENNSVQLSMDDIEKPLLRIHAKYMKISEELEHIATGRFSKCNSKTASRKGAADVSMLELDPEIKRIIDDVNRKYDDYFKTSGVLCD